MIKKIDGIVVVIISLIYGILSLNLEAGLNTSGILTSASFPLTVAFIIFILGLILIFKDGGVDHRAIWPKGEVGRTIWKKIIIFLLILFVYAYSFEFLGFIISTIILSTYISISLESKQIRLRSFWLKSFLSALIMCVAIHLLFVVILEINLPTGVLFE